MTFEEERLRARIAQELQAAMKARNASRVAALRSLVAALDNATAVPISPQILRSEKVEVPRKVLSLEDVRAVLMREIAERRHAAFALTAHGCFEEAAAVEAESQYWTHSSTGDNRLSALTEVQETESSAR